MLIIKPFGRLGNNISQTLKVISYALSFQIPEKINFIYLKRYQPYIFNNFPDYLFNGNTIEKIDTFWNVNIDYSKYNEILQIIEPFINYQIYLMIYYL